MKGDGGMSYIDTMKEKARSDKKTIVLPETNDKRTLIPAEQSSSYRFWPSPSSDQYKTCYTLLTNIVPQPQCPSVCHRVHYIMNQCSLQYGANTVFVGNVHQFSTPQIP